MALQSHEPCALLDQCIFMQTSGDNTAAPTHKCMQCKKNVHVMCAINLPDRDANFGEGHKCFNCSSEAELQHARVVWPPPSEQGDEEMKEGREEQEEDQEEDEQIVPSPKKDRTRAMARFAAPEDDTSWEMPSSAHYKAYLIRLMSFFHDTTYEKDAIFTREELLQLNPNVIKRWLSFYGFGQEEYEDGNTPGIEATTPIRRSTSVEQAKRAASFFMPNKKPKWVNGAGNPTKHADVSKVITDMKKVEASRKVVPPKAKRPMRIPDGSGDGQQASGGGGGGTVDARAPMSQDMYQTILMRLNCLDQKLDQTREAVHVALADQRSWIAGQFRTINNTIRVFGGTIEGGFLIQEANIGRRLHRMNNQSVSEPVGVENRVTLTKNPRSLVELWAEYKFGIGGRKAAEQFTVKERNNRKGGLKQKYYRRNYVWQCIRRLTNQGGLTVADAILRIRCCYGHKTPVSRIINAMIRDRKNGGHPNLR